MNDIWQKTKSKLAGRKEPYSYIQKQPRLYIWIICYGIFYLIIASSGIFAISSYLGKYYPPIFDNLLDVIPISLVIIILILMPLLLSKKSRIITSVFCMITFVYLSYIFANSPQNYYYTGFGILYILNILAMLYIILRLPKGEIVDTAIVWILTFTILHYFLPDHSNISAQSALGVSFLINIIASILLILLIAENKTIISNISFAITFIILNYRFLKAFADYLVYYEFIPKTDWNREIPKHANYSIWISLILLILLQANLLAAGYLIKGKKRPFLLLNTYFRYIFIDSTVSIVLGAFSILAIVYYPIMESLNWLGLKSIEPFHYWLAVLTFAGLWATPVVKGLFETRIAYNKEFQKYIENRVARARDHIIFAGFGHLGNIVFLELLRDRGFLKSESVVFPNFEVHSVAKNIIVIEKDPSLFFYSFRTSSGDTFGIIKRPYTALVAKSPADTQLQNIYLMSIMGDASRQDSLEKAHFREAENIICTIPNIDASFAVFDLKYDQSAYTSIE